MPGTISITEQNELFTSTMHVAGKEIVDQNDYNLPFWDKQNEIHGKGKPADEGGKFFVEPLEFHEHSSTTQMSNGYELVNLTVQSVTTPAKDEWGFWVRPVVISEKEKMQNRGSYKNFDRVKERTRTSIAGMRREMHKRIWGSGGAGLTDLNTLDGIADTGFLEEADAGLQTNTVHGIAKGSFATSLGWQNQAYDVADSWASNGLDGLTSIAVQCQSLMNAAEREGGVSDLCWYLSPTAFGHMKKATRSFEQYTAKNGQDAGRLELMWNGVPVYINRDMVVSGSSPMSGALIDHRWIRLRFQNGYFFKMGEFASPVNQLISAAPIKVAAQLEARFLGTSGVLHSAEVYGS